MTTIKQIWNNSNRAGALVFDFDKTLSPLYMQVPVFKALGVDEKSFWTKTNGMAIEDAKAANTIPNYELAFMHALLDLPGFKELDLVELGSEIILYPGVVELFKAIKQIPNMEIYIVSSGIKDMIEGTALYPLCDGVFACEYDQDRNRVINIVTAAGKCTVIDYIARGCNILGFDYFPPVGAKDRRINYEHMVYTGDGASDVPAFNLVKGKGGDTWGVFNPKEPAQLAQLETIRKDNRLSGIGVADYSLDHTTGIWLLERAKTISRELQHVKDQEMLDLKEDYIRKIPAYVHSWTKTN